MIGHKYTLESTIPEEYKVTFMQCPKKTLTICGNSKNEIIKSFKNSVLQSNLIEASRLGVELHASGFIQEILNVLIEVIGTHIHLSCPNLSVLINTKYKRYEKQMKLKDSNANVNNQCIRNVLIEFITLCTLSYQRQRKEILVKKEDIKATRLAKVAQELHIKDVHKMMKRNEIMVFFKVIEQLLDSSEIELIKYWITWMLKYEAKHKIKLPCKSLNILGVSKEDSSHWIFYIWKFLVKKYSSFPYFKQRQIINIYSLFCIHYKKSMLSQRIPLVYFGVELLQFDNNNFYSTIIMKESLYIQACANVNVLYKNLQAMLKKYSWKNVLGYQEPEPKPMKSSKKNKQKSYLSKEEIDKSMEYLDIIPSSNS